MDKDTNKRAEPLNWIERDIIESIAAGTPIITRFPPEPNGYMHIGHAKAVNIDYGLAKKYGGYMNLRFDDTNPEKEDMHYVDAMINDLKWLGIEWENLVFASDDYERLFNAAVLLIEKSLAYVDFQTPEEMSKNRGTLTTPGTPSKWRDTSPAENLDLFHRMRAGEFGEGHCVLRAKIDMAHGNMNMRDPAIYRIMHTPHYRAGDKWVIYPLYDFAHPLGDVYENVSHSICSLEYADHNEIYCWFRDNAMDDAARAAGAFPRQFEFSRLNIEQTIMSKRHLKKMVDKGVVDGWDDPRMPTISGMRRRGYPAAAIMKFSESTGVSRTPMTVPLSALEFYVRAELEPITPRVHVVFNPIKVNITNWKGNDEIIQIANNPNDETAGMRDITFGKTVFIDGEDFAELPPKGYKRLTPGGTVRLRGGYIIRCDAFNRDKSGNITIDATYFENSKSGNDTSGIKPDGTIHYVGPNGAEVEVIEYLPLLKTGLSLDEENINYESKIVHRALAEQALLSAKPGEAFQFVRKGFFIADIKSSAAGKPVFNMTVGLKSSV